MKKSPTKHQFTKYQKLYDYFNEALFDNELPYCLLILSRKAARVCGHFSTNRWHDKEGNKTHEINLNPVYMAMTDEMDICQTLVHEMVHLWQYEFGHPSRAGYHNREWADKMESVGLTPSHTGEEGGKKTGQQMSDYPTPNGKFLRAFNVMKKSLLLPFKSSEVVSGIVFQGGNVVAVTGLKPTIQKPKRKNKTKYHCRCGNNVWGKPNLKIFCADCKYSFINLKQ